jgi:hypothetical protein
MDPCVFRVSGLGFRECDTHGNLQSWSFEEYTLVTFSLFFLIHSGVLEEAQCQHLISLFGGNTERSGAKSLDRGNCTPSIGGSLRDGASISGRRGAGRESQEPSNAPSSPSKQSHLRGSAPSNAPSSPSKQSHLRGGGVATATDPTVPPLSPPPSSPNPDPDFHQNSMHPPVIRIENGSYHDDGEGEGGRVLVGDLARSAGVPEVMSPQTPPGETAVVGDARARNEGCNGLGL